MTNFLPLILQYKADKESVFNTWFINNEDRLKAFRSIRRGVMQVIEDIKCKKKLGSWSEYLKLREVLIETNNNHQAHLSLDLGAIAGLLFEIGSQKLVLGGDEYLSETERKKLEQLIEKRHNVVQKEKEDENLHTEMQYHLLKIGNALGYNVIAASNDPSRNCQGQSFSFISLQSFPLVKAEKEVLNTIQLIDVLWFEKGTSNVIAAFEVEKSTSIYSGILRLADLSYSTADGDEVLYLVVPDIREKDVRLQLSRPAIKMASLEAGLLAIFRQRPPVYQ